MYVISNKTNGKFFMTTNAGQDAEAWTASRGCANWFVTEKEARNLISAKANSQQWNAAEMQVLPAHAGVAATL